MRLTGSSEKEQNNEKNQKPLSVDRSLPKISDQLDVSVAVSILSKKSKPKAFDYRIVLGLLKSSKIKAGFFFPGDPLIWVSIPADYWIRLNPTKFAKSKSGGTVRIGAHRVQLKLFPEQFVEARGRKEGAPERDSIKLIAETLQTYEKQRDTWFTVEIDGASWREYLDSQRIDPLLPSDPAGSGRQELRGWKDMSVALAVYLASELRARPKGLPKALSVATGALELAKQLNPDSELPTVGTLEKEAQRCLRLIKSINQKPR